MGPKLTESNLVLRDRNKVKRFWEATQVSFIAWERHHDSGMIVNSHDAAILYRRYIRQKRSGSCTCSWNSQV